MRAAFDWVQLAAAVGAVQGLLLAMVLALHNGNRTANRLLAALMAAFAIYLVATVYFAAGLYESYPHFIGVAYPLPWVFGPLVYLYALTTSDAMRQLRARDALHFAPLIVVVVVAMPMYLQSGPEKIAFYQHFRVGVRPAYITVIDPSKYLSGVSYSIATLLYLRLHARRVENSYSNTDRVNLAWLRWLTGAATSIWLLAVAIRIAHFLPASHDRDTDNVVAMAIALLVFAIGYMGLRQPEIYRYDRAASDSPAPSHPDKPEPTEARYERSGLSAAEASRLKAQLLALMDREHPYRDPDLTLPQLAEQLDTSPHKLSEVLNSELAQSFYDFVNSYRVSDVRRRLVEPKSDQLSVLTLAMDAGFASKSTFNQAFKKLTGHTPSSYRRTIRA